MPSEVVDACIQRGVFERPSASRTHYAAFCDPSGGSADSVYVGRSPTVKITWRCSMQSGNASRRSAPMMSAASMPNS